MILYKNGNFENELYKMKFFLKDFFSKCDQVRSYLRICSQLLKKSLTENVLVCAVLSENNNNYKRKCSI